MLKAILRLIKDEPAPLERLRLARLQLLEDRDAAAAQVEAAKRQMDAAANALAKGDADADELAEAARKSQAAALKRQADIGDMIESLDRQIEAEQRRLSTVADAALWARIRDACKKREKAAARLQAAVREIGAASAALTAETSALAALLPTPRPQKLASEWTVELQSTVETHLDAVSDGAYGIEGWTMLYNNRAEFLARDPDVLARAQRQHRELLAPHQGDETHEREPDAA